MRAESAIVTVREIFLILKYLYENYTITSYESCGSFFFFLDLPQCRRIFGVLETRLLGKLFSAPKDGGLKSPPFENIRECLANRFLLLSRNKLQLAR